MFGRYKSRSFIEARKMGLIKFIMKELRGLATVLEEYARIRGEIKVDVEVYRRDRVLRDFLGVEGGLDIEEW